MSVEALLTKIAELIQQLLDKSTPPLFSAGDWIAIVVAALSAGTAIFATISSTLTEKRINLTAKARIDWVQNVRHATVDVISACNAALVEENTEEVLRNILDARGKIELLILYFGPERTKSKSTVGLLDEKTNKGKNDGIAKFLGGFVNEIMLHYKDVKEKVVLQAEQRLARVAAKVPDSIVDVKYEEIEKDGEKYPVEDYELEPCVEQEYGEASEALAKVKSRRANLYKKLEEIREMMRIYLKLEWNKAKKGK